MRKINLCVMRVRQGEGGRKEGRRGDKGMEREREREGEGWKGKREGWIEKEEGEGGRRKEREGEGQRVRGRQTD